VINKLVYVGNGWKACDTTGTATNSGYPEYAFTFDVATRAAAILRAEGAKVVLTHTTDTGVGPCITQRAAIGNAAHADASVSIHADGGPSGGYGFHVIVPGSIGRNAAIVAPSGHLGTTLRAVFHSVTGEAYATYLGGGSGLTKRTDLGGLNLSTVPKVFIECANMRNSADSSRVRSAVWRQRAAQGIALGVTRFLAP
jgi:N-acetylmuramoyl-L-alanine amidase